MATNEDDLRICQTLLHRAGQGDTAAFAGLYDRTAPAVFGLIRSVLPDARQAEDVTVDVYLHAWRTASQCDPARDDAFLLLMTTAGRYAFDRIRGVRHQDGGPEQPVAPGVVLALICFHGLKLAAVAELLGISRATAILYLNDALSSLRRREG